MAILACHGFDPCSAHCDTFTAGNQKLLARYDNHSSNAL